LQQSGLAFIKEDDLWNFGKPQGWGGVWRGSVTAAGVPSDPYLMTGYEHKVLHLSVHSQATSKEEQAEVERLRSKYVRKQVSKGKPDGPVGHLTSLGEDVTMSIQVDVLGCAGHPGCPMDWATLETITIPAAAANTTSYKAYTFESGFSAHWVRVVSSADVVATAYFHYT
jgi:hypothetical protein